MGLFSFLTGSRPAADDAAGTAPDTSAPGTGAERTAAAETTAAERTEPAGTDQPRETSTGDEEGWGLDTAALTAPAPPKPDAPAVGAPDPALTAELQGRIVEVIKTVYDPEIPVDIYELGLIYDIGVDAERNVLVKMTLTSPACPSAQQLPSEVRYKVKALPDVNEAVVDVVWDPPWDKDRMSDAAKLQLGFF